MSQSPRTPRSSEEEEPKELSPFHDTNSPPIHRPPQPEPKSQRVVADKQSLNMSKPTPILPLMAHADRKLGTVCGACGACDALIGVIGDLRKAEGRISYLMNRMERMDHDYNALLDQSRELANEVLNQLAQVAQANAPPTGAGNKELVDRLQIIEQRQDSQALATDVLEDHLMHLNTRHAALRVRVRDLEDDIPAVNLAAAEEQQGNDEGETSEGHSTVSDAVDPNC